MDGNHTVMEMKLSERAKQDYLKDLETLALFRSAVRYERTIYLVYGDDITNPSRMIVPASFSPTRSMA